MGSSVGSLDGVEEGDTVGLRIGDLLGVFVGSADGLLVGAGLSGSSSVSGTENTSKSCSGRLMLTSVSSSPSNSSKLGSEGIDILKL